jgi:hypothetical protein
MEIMNPQENSEQLIKTDESMAATPLEEASEETVATPVETPVEETETETPAQPEPVSEQPPTETATETSEEPPTPDAPEAVAAEEPAPAPEPPTKESILNDLKALEQREGEIGKHELDNLKQAFYKLRIAELDIEKKAYVESGGTEETFMPVSDPVEHEFKELMAVMREKRSKAIALLEKQKEENLILKLAIIDKLKLLVEKSDDVGKYYNDFKQLQRQWNDIKQVPQAKAKELWKEYQVYVEKFYDILKLNKEFRDLDFKKNLEIKQALCAQAERLAADDDVVSAFHQLQKLHQEYRDTGPVARDLREDLWSRFKLASVTINKRHQHYFQQMKADEQLNLDQKTIICEIVEGIECDQLKSYAEWDAKTKEVVALQNKWKSLGFAPRKVNMKMFDRFRRACDVFFKRKSEFFKEIKDGMSVNLEKKKALCEQAEALKDSTDWKEATEMLVKLQKEWKTIGPVQKKHSDAIWKRFVGACDYFFDRKSKETSSAKGSEQDNLKLKKQILEKLNAIDDNTDSADAESQITDLMKEWSAIGHVPFKEKDRLQLQYRKLIDQLFDKFRLNASKKRGGFKGGGERSVASGSTGSPLYRDREKLVRQADTMRSELHTYENNLGFLNTSSKKGSSLLDNLQQKVEKLKADIEGVQQKIKALDEEIAKEEKTE